MNNKTEISNFIVEDGQYLKRWDQSALFFDNFYILGPEFFNQSCQPTCLFHFPNNFHNDNNNDIDSDENGDQLTQFFFPDGIHFIENDAKYLSKHSDLSNPLKEYDHIIFIKSDGSVPHYYFGVRFRFNPYNRPSASLLYKVKTNANINNDEKNIEKSSFENMKTGFENEITLFNEIKTCPSCLFSFVFETRHPFFELYFNLINQIVHLELFDKSKSRYLHNLFNRMIMENQPNSMSANTFDISNDNDDANGINDEFVIIKKIDCQTPQETIDCIISIDDSTVTQVQNSSQINNKNHVELKHHKDDENNSNQYNSNTSWLEDIYCSRNDFLENLLRHNIFPKIGSNMIIHTGDSLYSRFAWRMPTRIQSCCNLIKYGIEPLLEWITLNDLLKIITFLFLEVNVIVVGTELEPIVRVVTALPHIVFPFAWMFPIMTIIPDSFIDVLSSPFPFIAGLFLNEKCLSKVFNLDDFDEIVIIDMENQTIKWPKKAYPNLACEEEYIFSLRKYCTTKKKASNFSNMKMKRSMSNDLLIIPRERKIKKKWQNINIILDKFKNMNIIPRIFHQSNDNINMNIEMFFEIDKIDCIVESILNNHEKVFISKIQPAIVTRVLTHNDGKKEIGSMLVDELFVLQFSNNEKDLSFIKLFMKTQMFMSYREEACKDRTDEEFKTLTK